MLNQLNVVHSRSEAPNHLTITKDADNRCMSFGCCRYSP